MTATVISRKVKSHQAIRMRAKITTVVAAEETEKDARVKKEDRADVKVEEDGALEAAVVATEAASETNHKLV